MATRIEGLESRTRLLDPRELMRRGWSVTRRMDGAVVRSTSELRPSDVITTQFADGSVVSTVDAISVDDPDK